MNRHYQISAGSDATLRARAARLARAWLALVLTLAVLLLVQPSMLAAPVTWSGSGDGVNWSDGGNWGGTAPSLVDTAIFNNVTSGILTTRVDASFAGVIARLQIHQTTLGAAQQLILDRSLTLSNVTAGSWQYNTTAANLPGSLAQVDLFRLDLNGNDLVFRGPTSSIHLSNQFFGTYRFTGGGRIYSAWANGTDGSTSLAFNFGTTSPADLLITGNATGTIGRILNTGGALNNSRPLTITFGANATVLVTNNSRLRLLSEGRYDTHNFVINNFGSLTVDATSRLSIDVNGGTGNENGRSFLNIHSGGTLTQLGTLSFGMTKSLQQIIVSNAGVWEVIGPNASFSNNLNNTFVNNTPTGLIRLSNATLRVFGTITNAGTLAGHGTLNSTLVKSGGSLIATNGTLTVLSTITGSDGTNVAASGGTLELRAANSFTAPTALRGGTVVITNDNNLGAAAAPVRFEAGGTLLSSGDVALDASRPIHLGSAGGTFNVTSQTTVVQGVISGAGGLTKAGAGTLTLRGNNTFSGASTLAAGTLIISNSSGTGVTADITVNGGTLAIHNSGGVAVGSGNSVTVNSGGRLSGGGTIAGSVTVNNLGTLQPGDGIGTFHAGTLSFGAGSRTDFVFLSPSVHDQIQVLNSGGLSISSGALVNLYTNNSTVAFDTPGLYQLVQYSGSIGGAGVGGWSVANPVNNRVYTFGTGGGWVTLTIGGTNGGWIGGGADNFWTTAANWVGSVAPVEFDQLVFDGNTRVNNTNDFAANTRFTGIVFTNTAGNFVLNGAAVRLVGDVVNHSGNGQTITLPVVLHGADRVVNTVNGTVTISGVVSDAGDGLGLIKRGTQTLILSGANTYSGATEIQAGVLRANPGVGLPAGSNLKLNGGVLETVGAVTLTRSLGTGGGSLQWTGSGGFAARDGQLTVNLGGAAATVIWDSSSFVPTGSELVFGSASANAGVVFVNPIDLNGGTRTVRVTDNAGSSGDSATLAGTLSNGGLTKVGAGQLVLAGNNTYTGATLVNAGTLIVNGTVAAGSALTLSGGATLGGTGVVGRLVAGSGTVAPGLSPGILTVDQLNPSANMSFNFEFTNIGSPDYTQPGASLNDVLRLTNATPFVVALGVTNTVNLYVNTTLTVGVTNVFRGGFYTDVSANFDATITGATYNVYLNNVFIGVPLYVKTVDETGTQFGGVNGWVMEFGVLGQDVAVIPEPNVLLLWLAGALTLYRLRRKRK